MVISSQDVMKQVKNGKKDFSNIVCRQGDFINANLREVCFKDADLSFSSFQGADLTGADMENCKLFWTDFSNAKLVRTNMKKAKITWSKLNGAYFENTDMRGADLAWSVMFDSNMMSQAKLDGANMFKIALTPADITPEGIELAKSEIDKLKQSMPSDIWIILKNSVKNTENTIELLHNVAEAVHQYGKENKIETHHEDRKISYVETKEYAPVSGAYKRGKKRKTGYQ
ncbi:MAG: pentapeptide repeat-containing protein [Candidatus Aenigmarchaeota archaeon]|nr:pentapeptide repeat-containing protein [Candidatus Aenigmarchaeota archaeon]